MPKPIRFVAPGKFWAKVDDSPGRDACWPWTGYINQHGYGVYKQGFGSRRDKSEWNAHRVAYELTIGSIPEGLVIDHLCRVRHCVNPAHLEPVTNEENLRRGKGYSRKPMREVNAEGLPVCRNGHVVAGENVRLRRNPRSPTLPIRDCVQCGRDRRVRAQIAY